LDPGSSVKPALPAMPSEFSFAGREIAPCGHESFLVPVAGNLHDAISGAPANKMS